MDNYWKRVQSSYDERRIVDPEFSQCLYRGQKAMANHWAVIQTACNKWHGIQEEVQNRPKSGANSENEVAFAVFLPPLWYAGLLTGVCFAYFCSFCG